MKLKNQFSQTWNRLKDRFRRKKFDDSRSPLGASMGSSFLLFLQRIKFQLFKGWSRTAQTLRSIQGAPPVKKISSWYLLHVAPRFSHWDDRWQFSNRLKLLLPASLVLHPRPQAWRPIPFLEWLNVIFTDSKARHWGVSFTLVACTWFVADLFALVLDKLVPEPPRAKIIRSGGSTFTSKPTLDSYNVIQVRNLFNSQGLIPGEGETDPNKPLVDPGGVPVKTALPFNLVGTVVLEDEIRSVATIEDRGVSQVFPVRIQDEIPGKAKIISIEPRKVIFLNPSTGRREFVELPDDGQSSKLSVGSSSGSRKSTTSTGVAEIAPNQYQVQRTEVDKALANLSQILTQARAIPYIENGAPAGYQLTQIVPGSIYSMLGLKNKDVLCGINGEPINDVGKAFEMLGELKTAAQLELCVKRGGKQMSFNYNIQ